MEEVDKVRILKDDDSCPDLPIVAGGGTAWAVVWPGVGAHLRSLHRISLEPGSKTVELTHPMDAVYYLMGGAGSVLDSKEDIRQDLTKGSMAHIDAGTSYVFEAGPAGAEILGGPCPPDPQMYRHLPGLSSATDPAGGLEESLVDHEEDGSVSIRIFHCDEPSAMAPMIAKDARLIVWPGVGADNANMNYVNMQPGERNVDHVHEASEDTIYILSGRGSIQDVTNDIRFEFGVGDVVHVPVGVWHAVSGDLGESIVSVGGPCPADWNMLLAAGLIPDEGSESFE